MSRFDQGSVRPSNLKVGRAGKGQTAESLAIARFVQPSNLVQPFGARPRARRREGAHVRVRARVCNHSYRSDRVRRLDAVCIGAGFGRPTCVQRHRIRVLVGRGRDQATGGSK